MLSIVDVCIGKISTKSNDGNNNEIFRVCLHYILVLKALSWIAYDEVKWGNYHEDLLCIWRCALFLRLWCTTAVQFTSKGRVVVQLLLYNLLFFSIPNLLVLYAMSNLSLAAEVMYISVSPGFWMIYSMILEQGLQMSLTVAYIDSPAM